MSETLSQIIAKMGTPAKPTGSTPKVPKEPKVPKVVQKARQTAVKRSPNPFVQAVEQAFKPTTPTKPQEPNLGQIIKQFKDVASSGRKQRGETLMQEYIRNTQPVSGNMGFKAGSGKGATIEAEMAAYDRKTFGAETYGKRPKGVSTAEWSKRQSHKGKFKQLAGTRNEQVAELDREIEAYKLENMTPVQRLELARETSGGLPGFYDKERASALAASLMGSQDLKDKTDASLFIRAANQVMQPVSTAYTVAMKDPRSLAEMPVGLQVGLSAGDLGAQIVGGFLTGGGSTPATASTLARIGAVATRSLALDAPGYIQMIEDAGGVDKALVAYKDMIGKALDPNSKISASERVNGIALAGMIVLSGGGKIAGKGPHADPNITTRLIETEAVPGSASDLRGQVGGVGLDAEPALRPGGKEPVAGVEPEKDSRLKDLVEGFDEPEVEPLSDREKVRAAGGAVRKEDFPHLTDQQIIVANRGMPGARAKAEVKAARERIAAKGIQDLDPERIKAFNDEAEAVAAGRDEAWIDDHMIGKYETEIAELEAKGSPRSAGKLADLRSKLGEIKQRQAERVEMEAAELLRISEERKAAGTSSRVPELVDDALPDTNVARGEGKMEAMRKPKREASVSQGGYVQLPGKKADPLESLKQEARKYKSAEEFVKNNFVAHGTNKEILGNLQPTNGWYGKAVYTTDDLANASGRNGGGVTYFVNKPQGKLLEINAHGSKGGSGFTPQQYQDAIKNGYDGLKIKHDDGKTWYAMFNEQTPHTKQQLTDLYNQAQVGKTTQATLKQANELVEPQATQLDRMGAVSAPQTLSKTGVDISSQADNTPISLKIKGQMSDANYLKRFGKERGAVKIKIKPFTPEDYAFERWKDRGALSLGRETLERNLDRVAGKDAPKVKKFLVEQSRNNEFQRAQFLNSKRGEVKNYIVDQLGIKPRSKESALVQKYGEGLIDDVQLNQEAGARAPQIAEAASYFRSQYDELLDQWNAVRTRYGYDEVPKRQDYFRHFKEINDNIMQLGMIPKSRDLPTSISGITDIFRPNKPFSNAELRRYTNETTFDAVGGFDNYLDSVSRQIFHTDTVQRGRYVENAIRKQAEDNPEIELPNFVANLGEWTNLVSGKKTRIDRASEQLLGRKVYGLMDALRRKTSANMVGANLSSAMSNFIPFTQSISTTSKPSVIKGMMSSATSPLRGDVNSIDGEVSSYLTRRFAKDAIVKVKGAKAADIASTPFKWVDEFTSRSIVAGKYYENLSKGLNSKEAMKAADDYASKVITDRSIGQLPNLMNTKTIGFITQFQAEINNQVSFLMRDIPELAGGNKVKIANMLGQFVVFSYLFNTGYEKVMGRRPQIDPIQAGIDMYQALNADNDDTTSEKVISGLKKAGDRIATGLPFVSVFTGGRLPVNAMLPDVPALTKGIGSIGSPEGTQWGQFYKGVSGPAFYGLPPFGGGQAKKTLEGLYSYSKGESTTPAGRQRFEVAQTPANLAKSLVFGQYSTDEGKQYIKQLGENQSGQGGGSKDKEYLKAFDAGERKFLSMTKKEQEEYLKQDQRFNGTKEKYRIWKIDQEGIDLPEGISDQSRDVLTQLAKTSERDKKAFKDKNLYAVELAEYEKDKLEGKLNDIEDGKRVKSLQRNKVYNDFDPLVRDLYSLNKTEFFRYIKNNPNGKALFAQAVALDDALVAIGLKSKLRNKYGQILEPGVRVARAKKGRSKKGGGKGRKGGVAKTGVVRLKSPKLRLSMSVVPPKVGKVSLKTSPKLRPASAKPVAKLSRVGSVKVRSNA